MGTETNWTSEMGVISHLCMSLDWSLERMKRVDIAKQQINAAAGSINRGSSMWNDIYSVLHNQTQFLYWQLAEYHGTEFTRIY